MLKSYRMEETTSVCLKICDHDYVMYLKLNNRILVARADSIARCHTQMAHEILMYDIQDTAERLVGIMKSGKTQQ